MAGTVVGRVIYRDGHSNYGEQAISVILIAYTTNLTVLDLSTQTPLFSIPWENISKIRNSVLRKKGLEDLGARILAGIPGLDMMRAASILYKGIQLTYWDDEIQRDLNIFFDTSSDRKADRYREELFRWRDEYFRTIGRGSRPDRR